MKKTNETLAAQAAKDAMKETERLCKKAGLTKSKVLTRVKEGLDAKNDYGADHRIRLKSAEIAIELLSMKPVERKQIEFPDENGKPQKIGSLFTDMERATRLVYLMNQAAKRKADGEKRSGKD